MQKSDEKKPKDPKGKQQTKGIGRKAQYTRYKAEGRQEINKAIKLLRHFYVNHMWDGVDEPDKRQISDTIAFSTWDAIQSTQKQKALKEWKAARA